VARCLDWWRGRLCDERGAVLVFVAVSLVGIIGFSGLAIDLGRGYVTKIRLSRAVDAGPSSPGGRLPHSTASWTA
jgi:hypothetical protein